jgi:nucleoside-diphosphate-sugar epimerase
MRIVVTGANGYLGGWVCKLLEVIPEYKVLRMDSHRNILGGDIGIHPSNVDVIIHLAWYSTVGDGNDHIHQQCVNRSKFFVNLAKERKDVRFIFTSSVSVYGDCGDRVVNEDTPINPNCGYTKGKALVEDMVRELGDKGLVLRLGSLMGLGVTRTKTDLCVNGMAVDGWIRKKIAVWNPDMWKPVIHVQDAAELIVEAIRNNWNGVINAANFNYTARGIARIVSTITDAKIEIVVDRNGPRSCRVDYFKICELTKSTRRKTVTQAVMEFEGFKESASNRNQPWPRKEESDLIQT